MPLFQYKAINTKGKKTAGFIEANAEKEARTLLREQGLMIKELSNKNSLKKNQNLKNEALMTFTLQLSQLIGAGIPLYESLVALEEQNRQEPYHQILLSLCEKIKAGITLSNAMSSFPESFNKLYCSMIAAGESVGSLDTVLERLSYFLLRQMKLKKQIKTAMIYPIILASFSLLIIVLLLGFVLPSIEGIFTDRPLNNFTTFILNISSFMRHYWWGYLPLLFTILFYIVHKLRTPAGKLWWQKTLLKIPFLKTLTIQAAIARFCRTMGTLQQGGLPIINSLQTARGVMHNVVIEKEIETAENRIIEGSSLSRELMHSKYIPTLVSRMLAVGEDSGTTVIMLNKLADIYEEEVEKNLDQTMALAQPIILICMGVIIGTILLAILLPLTDVSSFNL